MHMNTAEGSGYEAVGELMPAYDAVLSEEQLALWRSAENRFQLKTPKRRAVVLPEEAPAPTEPPAGTDFLQADAYLGPLRGFVYTTRDAALGYWREVARTPIVLCLVELLTHQAVHVIAHVTGKRARRQRLPNGARVVRPSRRQVAGKQPPPERIEQFSTI